MAIEYPDVGASFNLVKCFMACRSVVKQTNNASRCQTESRPMLGHIDVARHGALACAQRVIPRFLF